MTRQKNAWLLGTMSYLASVAACGRLVKLSCAEKDIKGYSHRRPIKWDPCASQKQTMHPPFSITEIENVIVLDLFTNDAMHMSPTTHV
jgi:hypothetical protein